MSERELFRLTADYAADFLASLPERPVREQADVAELREALGGALAEEGVDAERVVLDLIAHAEPGLVAIPGPRWFGFVIGGGIPAAVAADWLTSVWDQNAGLYVAGPAASVVEEVAGAWIAELVGLPAGVSVGFVTGGQTANFTALAAARWRVLERAGWDVNRDGLVGAPPVRVVTGAQRHVTIDRALRLLGLGTSCLVPVDADDQGRVGPDALRSVLREGDGPTIVCAQAGDVNTGAFDALDEVADAVEGTGAWLHVDGAFGLWAGASPSLRHLVAGVERADSWATDAHKWLNVPYDSGLVFSSDPDAHRAAMGATASYLIQAEIGEKRDEVNWVPEFSRRARGFAVYAALRALGRSGVAELVDRCCANARLFAEILGREDGVQILNDVVLNQVLVRFGDDDATTDAVVERVQEDGTCWLGGTTWSGRRAMRISVSNWSTTAADVERSASAILAAASVPA